MGAGAEVDLIVVGAGAAGLMAATIAAARGRRVVLLEKNRRAGLKVLISGGGRCNLTTTKEGEALEREFGARRGRWLRHALRSFPPRELCALVEAGGVPLQEEDLDKIFPVSGRAADVLGVFVRGAAGAGVELRYEAPMRDVTWREGQFHVDGLAAPRLVLATGGLSYPKTGATGDGYPVCARFGHRIVPGVPALAPLAVDADWVRELAGIVVDARLTLRAPDGRELRTRRRPTLFTHKGLSGPAPMDLSGDVEEHGGGCTLELDFAPDLTHEELGRLLDDACREAPRKDVAHLLPGLLPERLRVALAALAGAGVRAAELSRAQRHELLLAWKRARLRIDRSLGFAHAEVTRGGVALDEVDPRTMQSKLRPGLFLCGELLDVDGPIGGFNFQAAFATGRIAGLHASGTPGV